MSQEAEYHAAVIGLLVDIKESLLTLEAYAREQTDYLKTISVPYTPPEPI
jgi:hypothetical protein